MDNKAHGWFVASALACYALQHDRTRKATKTLAYALDKTKLTTFMALAHVALLVLPHLRNLGSSHAFQPAWVQQLRSHGSRVLT